MASSKNSRFGPAVLYLALCVAGLAVEVTCIRDFLVARRALSWPTAEGTIIKSDMEETHTLKPHFDVRVAYVFEVDGHRYESSSVRTRGTSTDHRSDALATLRNYPVGSIVEVHYEPDHPSTSYLEVGVDWINYVLIVSPLLFAGMFALGLYETIKTPWAPFPLASMANERLVST